MTKKQLITKAVASISVLAMVPWTAFATESSLDLTMTGGTLSISAPSNIVMTGKTVSLYDQTTTGTNDDTTYAKFKVTDTRGTLAGWTFTGSSTALTRTGSAVSVSGSTPTARMGFSGTYTCGTIPESSNGAGKYKVTIAAAGAVGVATFTWLKPDGTTGGTAVTTASSVLLDSGVSATFTGTQVLSDAVALPVGCASPLAQQAVTPSSLVASSTASTGVSLGAGGALTSTRTIITAEAGSGHGEYRATGNFAFTILKNALAGAHATTFTVTII